jgi:hypothetical protein
MTEVGFKNKQVFQTDGRNQYIEDNQRNDISLFNSFQNSLEAAWKIGLKAEFRIKFRYEKNISERFNR